MWCNSPTWFANRPFNLQIVHSICSSRTKNKPFRTISILMINALPSIGAICKSPLQQNAKNLMPISMFNDQCSMINVQWSMINDQWLMINDPYSLITDLCSLFTAHFSLFTALSPPTSILISHNDSSWLVHQKCCTFASYLKQVLGVSLQKP